MRLSSEQVQAIKRTAHDVLLKDAATTEAPVMRIAREAGVDLQAGPTCSGR